MTQKKFTNIIWVLVCAALVGGIVLYKFLPYNTKTLPTDTRIGVWKWEAPTAAASDDAKLHEELSALRDQNITDCYIDISTYIDAFEEPDQQKRTQKLQAFSAALKKYVSTVSAYDMRAHGVAGSPKWSDPINAYIPPLFLSYAEEYNRTAKSNEKLYGLQFDIEPYLDKKFQDQGQISSYISVAFQIVDAHRRIFADAPDFELGFAMPAWFDTTTGVVDDHSQPIAFHVIDKLASLKNGYIAIMAYRDKTNGPNGSIAIADKTVRYAAAKNVKILIGQEASRLSEPGVSFYGKSKKELKNAIAELNAAFQKSTLTGFVINDAESFLELREE